MSDISKRSGRNVHTKSGDCSLWLSPFLDFQQQFLLTVAAFYFILWCYTPEQLYFLTSLFGSEISPHIRCFRTGSSFPSTRCLSPSRSGTEAPSVASLLCLCYILGVEAVLVAGTAPAASCPRPLPSHQALTPAGLGSSFRSLGPLVHLQP